MGLPRVSSKQPPPAGIELPSQACWLAGWLPAGSCCHQQSALAPVFHCTDSSAYTDGVPLGSIC